MGQVHQLSEAMAGRDTSRVEMPRWLTELERLCVQQPLIASRMSLASLGRFNPPPRAPRAIFTGIGLCSGPRLTHGIPLDVLGMLLPAELIRRRTGAESLVVLIADAHAHAEGGDPSEVARRTRAWSRTLGRVGDAFGFERLQVLRASQIHEMAEYRAVLAEIEKRAPANELPYFKRQAADIAFFHRHYGSLVKVGWTIGPMPKSQPRGRDEVAFDEQFRAWTGSQQVGFVYCKAGRAFDDARPKAAPYLAFDVARRVCLHPDEDFIHKLRHASEAAGAPAINGTLRHLKAITRCSAELGQPLRGPLERRIARMLKIVFGEIPSAQPVALSSAPRGRRAYEQLSS